MEAKFKEKMMSKKPKVVLIVQARMGSTRLPGKHLKQVFGKPLIVYLFERLRRVGFADDLLVATTTNPKDDVLVDVCDSHQIPYFRGSEEDVLNRFFEAAKFVSADVIVRICADCPLIDPAVIDETICYYLSHPSNDMVSNVVQRTYPRGMDVEVFSFQSLESTAREACYPEDREHVTSFVYKHPERFRLGSVTYPTNESVYRWTVDTDEDFALISLILEEVYPKNPLFSLGDLLACAKQHPEWNKINASVKQKEVLSAVSVRYGLELVRPIEEHGRLIFDWRNDPATRKASFHDGIKDWDVFYSQFLREYFNFPDLPPLFVVEEGRRVAFLRLEMAESPLGPSRKCCEISINVAPDFRGRGVGRKSLLLAKELLRTNSFDDVYAEIKTENVSSMKAFAAAGFEQLPDKEVIVFDTGDRIPIYRFLARISARDSFAQQRVYIIAEAGSNWRTGRGPLDFTVAKELIESAARAGADAIKFQLFRPSAIYVPNAGHSNYLVEAGIQEDISRLFENLAMPPDMIPILAGWAKAAGIDFMATPFSPQDFAIVDPFVSRHKIASYEIGYQELIALAATSGKPLILSTGAAEENEIAWAVEEFRRHKGQQLTLMQCTACYPAEPQSVNLRVIPWLKRRFRVDVGLSDHSLDPLLAPLGAVSLGAIVVEKHLTLDRRFEGPDHLYALVPQEFEQMVKAIRNLEPMLGSGMKGVHPSEKELRRFARRGVQAIKNIAKGESFVEKENIAILRPGNQQQGVHPLYLERIKGCKAKRDIPLGSGVQFGDF